MGRGAYNGAVQRPVDAASRGSLVDMVWLDETISSGGSVTVGLGNPEDRDQLVETVTAAYTNGDIPDDDRNVRVEVDLHTISDYSDIQFNPGASTVVNLVPPMPLDQEEEFTVSLSNNDAQDVSIRVGILYRPREP